MILSFTIRARVDIDETVKEISILPSTPSNPVFIGRTSAIVVHPPPPEDSYTYTLFISHTQRRTTLEMSAYGTISAPNSSVELSIHSWPLVNGLTLTTYPVFGANCPRELIDYFHKVFNDELEGMSLHPGIGSILMTRRKDIPARGTT